MLDGKGDHPFAILGVPTIWLMMCGVTRVLPPAAVQIRFAEQAVASGLQSAEMYCTIGMSSRSGGTRAVLNHIARRQLVDAVAKQAGAVAVAVVMVLVDPALAQR